MLFACAFTLACEPGVVPAVSLAMPLSLPKRILAGVTQTVLKKVLWRLGLLALLSLLLPWDKHVQAGPRRRIRDAWSSASPPVSQSPAWISWPWSQEPRKRSCCPPWRWRVTFFYHVTPCLGDVHLFFSVFCYYSEADVSILENVFLVHTSTVPQRAQNFKKINRIAFNHYIVKYLPPISIQVHLSASVFVQASRGININCKQTNNSETNVVKNWLFNCVCGCWPSYGWETL